MVPPPPAAATVVAGAVIENGRVLLAQRATPPELAGRWELPGGKIEPGETPQDALVRELREELGIDVTVGDPVGVDVPLPSGHVLRAYAVRRVAGTPSALDHDAVRWVGAGDLHEVDWVPADREWIADLVALLSDGSA